MTEVGVAEAKAQQSELLDRVERGEEVVITRHGRPVAKVSAVARTGGPIAVPPCRQPGPAQTARQGG